MRSNHFHHQYELYYLLSGERNYFIKDKTIHVMPGDLVLINKNELHKTTDSKSDTHTRVVINFNERFLLCSVEIKHLIVELFNQNNYTIPFSPTDRPTVESYLNRMAHEIEHQEIGFAISLQLLLMELLVYSRRYLEKIPLSPQTSSTPTNEKVTEVVQYINENFHLPLSLESLSKIFFISPYYLSRIFRSVTGFTFIEYLNNIRIREAQNLLLETNDKITVIGEKVGFGNTSHFGRVFKTITNLSPLAYRKLHRLKEKTVY